MSDVSEFFVHKTTGKNRKTVRLDLNSLILVPSENGLIAVMDGSMARVHPKDKYNHKVGRVLTREKHLEPMEFRVAHINYNSSGECELFLANTELNLTLLVIVGGSKKVFVETL